MSDARTLVYYNMELRKHFVKSIYIEERWTMNWHIPLLEIVIPNATVKKLKHY
jgi:hypothetical protein